jgi:ketosteroid isomerase-like protein
LAICFAVPTFAQQKEPTPSEQDRQQLHAHVKKSDEAWNNNHAAALAATFTEDAANVTNKGPIYGREATEKHYADLFKQFHVSNHLNTVDGEGSNGEATDIAP